MVSADCFQYLRKWWHLSRCVMCTGSVCEVNIDECSLSTESESSTPCLNNATCIDLVNSFRCECNVGFTGMFLSPSVKVSKYVFFLWHQHIRSHRAPCSCFTQKLSLQLSSEQSVGDVWIAQLDRKRVPQVRSSGCISSVAVTAQCSCHHASRNVS